MKELKETLRKKILEAIRKGRIEERDGIFRFSDRIGDIPRGTVVIGKRIIYGYPKIRRVFSLMKGVEKNLNPGGIWVEEKIDGFNLRVAYAEGKIICISRGGFLDYFAAEKVSADAGIRKFFRENPEKVLYMEMIGNTPYTNPTRNFDVKYYIFDVGNGKNRFAGPDEMRKVCKKYGLESVPLMGKVTKEEPGKLKRFAVLLDKGGKEGMVLKQHLPRRVMKYVVPSSDIRDLGECSHMLFDMPAGFMKQRVFRSAVSVAELGLDQKEYDGKLGEALHKKLYGTINGEGEISERFEVLVKSRETWKKILSHMSSEVRIEVDSERKEKEGIRIRFRKIYKRGSRQVRRAIEGYAQTD